MIEAMTDEAERGDDVVDLADSVGVVDRALELVDEQHDAAARLAGQGCRDLQHCAPAQQRLVSVSDAGQAAVEIDDPVLVDPGQRVERRLSCRSRRSECETPR